MDAIADLMAKGGGTAFPLSSAYMGIGWSPIDGPHSYYRVKEHMPYSRAWYDFNYNIGGIREADKRSKNVAGFWDVWEAQLN
jgi:hypothetical protein